VKSTSRLPELYENMLAALRAARKQANNSGVDHQHDPVTLRPRSEAYVREQMLQAVNAHRSARGLAPVTTAEVQRVEAQANGHFDYVNKLALYCAELARHGTALPAP
jgi:hypothetical protein